ncbi:MAG: hypothetical protein ACRDJM_06310 [Actinomycetota bacterium]
MTTEWEGPVPKPVAVFLLQAAGVFGVVAGVALLALARSLDWEGFAKIYLVLGLNMLVAAPFALIAGWKRPPGLVAGVVALAILLAAIPIGPFIVAIVGFLGVKNRDHVRDYYSQRLARR